MKIHENFINMKHVLFLKVLKIHLSIMYRNLIRIISKGKFFFLKKEGFENWVDGSSSISFYVSRMSNSDFIEY